MIKSIGSNMDVARLLGTENASKAQKPGGKQKPDVLNAPPPAATNIAPLKEPKKTPKQEALQALRTLASHENLGISAPRSQKTSPPGGAVKAYRNTGSA